MHLWRTLLFTLLTSPHPPLTPIASPQTSYIFCFYSSPVPQQSQLVSRVQAWLAAGIIDSATADRILVFESSHERRSSLRWPVFLALLFGAILLAAGGTLFVAAHWAVLSPTARFTLVLFMVVIFHVAGAFLSMRFSSLSVTLHAVGTATLGAAIFLTAQIFNLHENWATGVLLWAIGAAVGYLLLRQWPQAAALALLVPAWLIAEWTVTTASYTTGPQVLGFGLLLTSLSYLSVRVLNQDGPSVGLSSGLVVSLLCRALAWPLFLACRANLATARVKVLLCRALCFSYFGLSPSSRRFLFRGSSGAVRCG